MKKKFRVTWMLYAMVPVCTLFFCVFFTGCDDNDQEEDYSIGEITIYNIPENIPVFDNEEVTAPVFKIYLNASNSQSENDPPAAKGVAEASKGTRANDKYSVTIQLQKPNPKDEPDPNFITAPWSGTASYFSVVISPYDVTNGVNTIWAKAGTTLNKGKKSCDWESLMDFRALIKSDPEDKMEFAKKTNALFTDIVCKDPDIKK
ncbi:MAG: hypothetical protein LBC52_07970 [Treponema sp.]|nr:hypothetical protein [Treponema sp.]